MEEKNIQKNSDDFGLMSVIDSVMPFLKTITESQNKNEAETIKLKKIKVEKKK